MSSRRFIPFIALSIALAGLTGCASGASPESGDGGTTAQPSAVATWRAEEPGTAWLRIGDDGAVTGSDGCNDVTGTASVSGDAVDFSMGLMTLKACSGVTLTFQRLTSGELSGDVLTVRDRDGADLVELHRSAD